MRDLLFIVPWVVGLLGCGTEREPVAVGSPARLKEDTCVERCPAVTDGGEVSFQCFCETFGCPESRTAYLESTHDHGVWSHQCEDGRELLRSDWQSDLSFLFEGEEPVAGRLTEWEPRCGGQASVGMAIASSCDRECLIVAADGSVAAEGECLAPDTGIGGDWHVK